jgi:hypothetical protein
MRNIMPVATRDSAARKHRISVDVKQLSGGEVPAGSGFIRQLAARQMFWGAVARAQPDQERTSADRGEEKIVKELGGEIVRKHSGLEDVRVAVIGYGSIELLVTWLGPDLANAMGGWVIDGLHALFPGPEFLLKPLDPEGSTKEKGSTAATIVAAWVGILPRHPCALLFAVLFVLGLALVEKSSRSIDRLIDARTTLIEKLGDPEQNAEKAATVKSKDTIPNRGRRCDSKDGG